MKYIEKIFSKFMSKIDKRYLDAQFRLYYLSRFTYNYYRLNRATMNNRKPFWSYYK